uniref:Pre-mRNA-splicing factor SYF2 n=2 Tax=Kalmanozyma brasiliensis (strain GHG001) TaxID=1365824 RepID=V5F0L8_KALBG
MAASTRANRKDILSEQSRSRAIAADLKNPSASRKIQKAEKVLEERDLRESGEDVERHRNMHYSLEDSERWDAKLEEKERRKDQGGVADFGDAAERAYQRQVRMLRPNVAGYKKQQTEAEAIKASSPASTVLIKGKGRATAQEVVLDDFHYGAHKPSDDAIDRVVSHLNQEKQMIKNRSRRRQDDPDAEVNYINDGNKHFNKKLKRFYDKQTQEIRENLERGTAL